MDKVQFNIIICFMQDPSTPLLLEPDKKTITDKKHPDKQPVDITDLSVSMTELNEETEIGEEPVKTFLSFLWLWSGKN